MIEAAMIWNEPNNKSHWDFEIDPDWTRVRRAWRSWPGEAIAAESAGPAARARRHLADRSATSSRMLDGQGVLDSWTWSRCTASRSTGTTGRSTNGRHKLDEIRAVTDLPVWVSEVGVSTFGAEEVQEWGLQRTAELLIGRAPRIHWYSLYDLPRGLAGDDAPPRGGGLVVLPALLHGPAATRTAAEARARAHFREFTPEIGHLPVVPFRGPPARRRGALDAGLGVTLSAHRACPGRTASARTPSAWFDRQMRALEDFDVTVDVLLHAGAPGQLAAPHRAAAGIPRSSPSSAPR